MDAPNLPRVSARIQRGIPIINGGETNEIPSRESNQIGAIRSNGHPGRTDRRAPDNQEMQVNVSRFFKESPRKGLIAVCALALGGGLLAAGAGFSSSHISLKLADANEGPSRITMAPAAKARHAVRREDLDVENCEEAGRIRRRCDRDSTTPCSSSSSAMVGGGYGGGNRHTASRPRATHRIAKAVSARA